MLTNKTRTEIFARANNDYEIFDALPREVKEFLWNAPISMTTGQKVYSSLSELPWPIINERLRLATIQAWGESHPQAQSKRHVLTAAQLGF
jgi:hypothetical protein